MGALPPEAMERLAQVGAGLVKRGDVFWVPKDHVVYYASTKDRFCIVAALEKTEQGKVAHLVPGTSGTARGPALVVQVGETELRKRTEFDFSTSFPLLVDRLVSDGRPRGALPRGRMGELDQVILSSNRVALKRLVGR